MNIFISLSVIFWSLFPSLISYTQGNEPPQKNKLTNLVINGDFSEDTILGWTNYNKANLSYDNGQIKSIINPPNGTFRYNLTTASVGKYYVYFNHQIINSINGTVSLRFQNSSNSDVFYKLIKTGLTNNTYDYSDILDITSVFQYFGLQIGTTAVATSLLDNVILINLTANFGVDNEPSKTFMDELINDIGFFRGDYYYSSSLTDNYKWFSTGFVDKTSERDFLDYLGFFVWLVVPPISIYLLYKLMKGVIYD